jgi:hypothetical protein
MGIVYGQPSPTTGFRDDSSLHWINRWTSLSITSAATIKPVGG